MSKFNIIITSSLAMFAMFFGSGNLVFPLKVGIQTNNQYIFGCLGFVLTGVIVPFIGLFSMVLYQGKQQQYFGLLGRYAPFILSFLMLSLLGPFGVVPRCVIVAYGGVSLLWPKLPFWLFSLGFSIAIIAMIWQKSKFIPLIGKFLAPVKIASILGIIIVAIFQGSKLNLTHNHENALLIGLYEGYQTMDLLAAFFFSITIIEYLNNIGKNKKDLIKVFTIASIIAASLIAVIYLGLIIIGAYYQEILIPIKPEQYLSMIASITLGKHAILILAITMFVACLTTASSLSKLFAEFIQNDVCKGRISWKLAIFSTIIISFLLSLTGFSQLAKVLATILSYIYPALIMFAVTSILHKLYDFKYVKHAFWLSIIATIICKT